MATQPSPFPDESFTDALATLHDAGAVRVPPWLALVAALGSIRPVDIGETIDWLTRHRDALARSYAAGRDHRLGLARVRRPQQQAVGGEQGSGVRHVGSLSLPLACTPVTVAQAGAGRPKPADRPWGAHQSAAAAGPKA